MSATKLAPATRAMLDRICRATDGDGAFLQLTVQANGDVPRARKALNEKWIETCDHPIIKTGDKGVPAVHITPAGRAALEGQ